MTQLKADFDKILDIIKPSLENGPWIAGGFAMRLYAGMCVKDHDVDVFVRDEEQYSRLVNAFSEINTSPESATLDFDGSLISYESKLRKAYETVNATTFHYVFQCPVQIVKPKPNVTTLEDVLDTFDINCCKIATDGKEFVATESTYSDIDNRILNFSRVKENSLWRFTKYVAYGFTPSKETIQLFKSDRGIICWRSGTLQSSSNS